MRLLSVRYHLNWVASHLLVELAELLAELLPVGEGRLSMGVGVELLAE
jgi:hypothetical protein